MSTPIHIINASSLTRAEVDIITASVREIFGLPVHALQYKLDLESAYDASRRQFNSTSLLAQLLTLQEHAPHKLIAIVDVDLYIPVLTFVYGEAQFNGTAAVVSMYRLTNKFYGVEEHRPLLINRIVKEIVHELGHTFGLYHCHQFECVMRSSTYVEEIDLKKETLCGECMEVFYQKVR